MDFANEEYRRLYVRDTITWKRLGWAGQCVLMQVLRKMDRSGVLELSGMEPAEAVALVTGGSVEEIETGLGRLLHLEVLKHVGDALVWPRFVEGQTVNKSDKQRQRESRDKRRANSLAELDDVTKRDGQSQIVTEGHTRSHAVTLGHTASHAVTHSRAEQNEAQPSRPESSAAAAVDGLKFVAGLLGRNVSSVAPAGSFAAQYAWIAARPADEQSRVAAAINADEWCVKNPSRVDAPHVVKGWQKYLAGPVKHIARAVPQQRNEPTPLAHQIMKF